MYARQKLTRSLLIIAVLATAMVLTNVDTARAQIVYPKIVANRYYHKPIPAYHGPVTTRYSPSTSSFYSVPQVTQPATRAPIVFRPAPLVYSQTYSFFSGPRYAYYPSGFSSYVPQFPSRNIYRPADPLEPYISGGGTVSQSMAPYQTPLYFRY